MFLQPPNIWTWIVLVKIICPIGILHSYFYYPCSWLKSMVMRQNATFLDVYSPSLTLPVIVKVMGRTSSRWAAVKCCWFSLRQTPLGLALCVHLRVGFIRLIWIRISNQRSLTDRSQYIKGTNKSAIGKGFICSFGALSIQPKNSGNFSWYITWNGLFWFRPTTIFGTSFEGGPLWPVWSFRSVRRIFPFHLTKLLSPVPLFCILLMRTITKCAVAWVRPVQPDCAVPLGIWNFQNFKQEVLLNGKHPWCTKIQVISNTDPDLDNLKGTQP